MRTAIVAAMLVTVAGAAHAKIPQLNATCPGGIEVHADAGGPVYVNGTEAKLHKSNDSYYEAKGGGVTVSIAIAADGSPDVSYTGHGGANGICTVAGGGGGAGGGCPADVSEADRYKYPACN